MQTEQIVALLIQERNRLDAANRGSWCLREKTWPTARISSEVERLNATGLAKEPHDERRRPQAYR